MQPLAIQNMAATIKAMGLSDNTINETIHRMPMPGASPDSPGEEDTRAAVMREWVNE